MWIHLEPHPKSSWHMLKHCENVPSHPVIYYITPNWLDWSDWTTFIYFPSHSGTRGNILNHLLGHPGTFGNIVNQDPSHPGTSGNILNHLLSDPGKCGNIMKHVPRDHMSSASESQGSHDLGLRVPKVIIAQPQSPECHANLAWSLKSWRTYLERNGKW